MSLTGNDATDLQKAYALHQNGRLKEAAALYRSLIQRNGSNFQALHLLGLSEASLGNFEQAKAFMARSLSATPPNIQFFENYATVLFQTADYESAIGISRNGLRFSKSLTLDYLIAVSLFKLDRYSESLEQFDKLLSAQPNNFIALNERGSVLAALKQFETALASVDKAISINRGQPEAHLNRGNLCCQLERLDDAIAAYQTALKLKPDLADAWVGLGNTYRMLKRFDEALAAYDNLHVSAAPRASAWVGRGNIFQSQKRYDDALTAFSKALEIRPDIAEAWLGCGNVCCDRKQFGEALVAYDKALALNSKLAEAWLGRGNAFLRLKKYHDADAAYGIALGQNRNLAHAWLGRATLFQEQDSHDNALDASNNALSLNADFAEAWLARGNALVATDQLTEGISAFDKALSIKPELAEAITARIFAMDFLAESGFAEQQEARRLWWQQVGAAISQTAPVTHSNTREPHRRIKIGYVSADFRSHSAALSFKPILSNHDKTQFEITCFSSTHSTDALTGEFRKTADRWRDALQLTDEELDAQIRADQIDILVDLSGHSEGNRLGVFARKPAPIQVTAWGHATGTGLPTIDYFFSDQICCPDDVRHLFAERVVDLPCVMTFDPMNDDIPSFQPPILQNGYVTFGVFNRVAKMSDDSVAIWSRILHEVPSSRIVLKNSAFDAVAMRSRFAKRFATHGIAADRVTFLGRSSRADHLAAFGGVDISLDPFPSNGGISTWESLQMGVPVVTKLGNSIPSRSGGAILNAIGLSDWVADSADGYVAIAMKYAAMPGALKGLRSKLPAIVAESEASNCVKYTRAVEAAYRRMWREYCGVT